MNRISRIRYLALLSLTAVVHAADRPPAASHFTEEINKQVLQEADFSDQQDFIDARKGFIATLPSGEIRNPDGSLSFSMAQYGFLKEKPPTMVNPALWRQNQLVLINGLFKVTDGIYQIRGFDTANMTFVRSDSGWIVIDTLTTPATAKAGYELLRQKVADLPIVAVIITHNHGDHFGGLGGLLTAQQLAKKEIPIIVPEGFYEAAVGEYLTAGNAMNRRADYMFGNILPKQASGTIGSGLGLTTAAGPRTLLPATREIGAADKKITLDGIDIEFMLTPGAEAPAEFMLYLPKYKAFCQAEEINHTQHNLYTLRGTSVRNGLSWSKYIDQALVAYGDRAEVSFGSHHWPVWGTQNIKTLMTGQRDLYRYLHDQTLRLANMGYTMDEIAEQLTLPPGLSRNFANRGYYGTLSHNVKAQYQLYLGWFSGNPSDLNPLPPVESAKKYVEFMGGADEVVRKARRSYEQGEYRWVATVMKQVVFADPNNKAGKALLAEAWTQLGYQAESGPWRNFYLSGAQELREGVKPRTLRGLGAEVVSTMQLSMLLDYVAIHLNGPQAASLKGVYNLKFTDSAETAALYLENGVLNSRVNVQETAPTATLQLSRVTLDKLTRRQLTVAKAQEEGLLTIGGDSQSVEQLFASMADFDPSFTIATP